MGVSVYLLELGPRHLWGGLLVLFLWKEEFKDLQEDSILQLRFFSKFNTTISLNS